VLDMRDLCVALEGGSVRDSGEALDVGSGYG
jgi:hypothetical protein